MEIVDNPVPDKKGIYEVRDVESGSYFLRCQNGGVYSVDNLYSLLKSIKKKNKKTWKHLGAHLTFYSATSHNPKYEEFKNGGDIVSLTVCRQQYIVCPLLLSEDAEKSL
jgi:hypothetical protein